MHDLTGALNFPSPAATETEPGCFRSDAGACILTRRCGSADVSEAAYRVYDDALKGLAELDMAAYRIWNFIPAINEGRGDAETYRQFCLGRARALADNGLGDAKLCAASGVGALRDAKLSCVFFASSHTAQHFENPRQVSAYRYPRQYGPKPPSFARATLHQGTLFISGTASIVGHETQHVGDVVAQTRETCNNVEALLAKVRAEKGVVLEPNALRVYLRHAADLPAVSDIVRQRFPNVAPAFLHTDICRETLLVEMEGEFLATT